MVTIEIPKKELLRQLPQMAGYSLIQWLDEMPDRFIFQGLPIQTKDEEVMERHPEIRPLLTPKEWALFLALYRRGKVTHSTLLASLDLLDEESFIENSNTLTVHMKALRRALRGSQFRILTFRKAFNIQGAYKMIEITQ